MHSIAMFFQYTGLTTAALDSEMSPNTENEIEPSEAKLAAYLDSNCPNVDLCDRDPSTRQLQSLKQVCLTKFDPQGDIILVLDIDDERVAHFQVNSGTLCVASPVFRAMVGPDSRFRERQDLEGIMKRREQKGGADVNPEALKVYLSDDDPNALAIALRIIHFHPIDQVPTTENSKLDQNKMHQLVILCDKYDMKHALLPWFNQWTAVFVEQIQNNQNIQTLWSMLQSTWVLGNEDLFRKVTRKVILDITLDGGNISQKELDVVPKVVLDEIQAIRKRAMDEILTKISSVLEEFINPQRVKCHFNEPICDATNTGLLINILNEQRVDPIKLATSPLSSHLASQSLVNVQQVLNTTLSQWPTYIPSVSTFQNRSSCCSASRFEIPTAKYNVSATNCAQCNRMYSVCGTKGHAMFCSPLKSVMTEVNELLEEIKGLEYSKFKGEAKERNKDQPRTDLWSIIDDS